MGAGSYRGFPEPFPAISRSAMQDGSVIVMSITHDQKALLAEKQQCGKFTENLTFSRRFWYFALSWSPGQFFLC